MNIPQSVTNTLWSYDINQLDTKKNKNLIIFSVLNWGSTDAVVWLQNNYSKEDILETIKNSNSNNWSRKSLNYWSQFFSISPKAINRFA